MENLKSRTDSELTLTRLEYLIQVGFTKKQIAEITNIKPQTLRIILKKYPAKVSLDTHNKVKQFHSDFITNKTTVENAIPEDDEPVFDPEDVEQGVREMSRYAVFICLVLMILLFSIGILIKYIIDLF